MWGWLNSDRSGGVGVVEVVGGVSAASAVAASAAAAATAIAPINLVVNSLMASVTMSTSTHSSCPSLCLLLCFLMGPTWGVCLVSQMTWQVCRRWGWVVLTWCCIIWWELDNEDGGMYDLMCADLIIILIVMFEEGSMRWEVLTWWYLHFSCFLFLLFDLFFLLICLC